MATKTKKKPETKNELLESSEALAERLTKGEQFLEKNKRLVFIAGGAIAVALVGIFFFNYYRNTQNEKAQVDIFQAQYYFEQDSLEKALHGDGNNLGFLDIIDDYPMSKAANLATFYTGTIYLKQGEYDKAVEYLKKFSSDDLLVQARAYGLIGDALMEQGHYADAADQYMQAANYKPNEFMTPIYLTKAALANEKLGDINAAIKAYDEIIEKYKDSSEYQNALKQKARIETKQKSS